jgi:hypothetical protein
VISRFVQPAFSRDLAFALGQLISPNRVLQTVQLVTLIFHKP